MNWSTWLKTVESMLATHALTPLQIRDSLIANRVKDAYADGESAEQFADRVLKNIVDA